MKTISNIWSIILGFLFIGMFGYLLTALIYSTSRYILSISPNIAAAIIAGLVTVIGYFLSRNFERKKIIEQQIREKKLPVYEEFIDFVFKILISSKSDQPISPAEIEMFMFDFNKKSIVWLSDSTLNAFIKWKSGITTPTSNNENGIESLFMLEELMLEFRKDIGHKNQGLKKGDILALFVTDVEKYLNN